MSIRQEQLPKTHQGLTQRSWQWIREGLKRCQENPDDRQRCLEWCQKFSDHTVRWVEILRNQHQDVVECALQTENFFALPVEEREWWEPILQNHPFAAIFARERYAALLEKRRNRRT